MPAKLNMQYHIMVILMHPNKLGKKFLIIAVFKSFLVSPIVYADSDVIINPDNSHSYQRIDSSVTWSDANNYCKNNNAYLATITSSQENAFIFDQFVNGQGKEPWLGGTDEFNEGTWEWVTGEAWSFSYWAPGEPNDSWGNEDYLSYSIFKDEWGQYLYRGQWDDQSLANSFICERNEENISLVSPDQSSLLCGIDWQWVDPLPQGNTLNSVAYNGSIYVAVGEHGTILVSNDGVDWDLNSSPTPNALHDIIWASGEFIAVGDNGTIITSLDGITWMIYPSYLKNRFTLPR